MKLNEQIRAHRKKAGLTQEQVAHSLGVSTPAVNKWERGSTYPDITLLAPLARLLKIDLNTLFTFHESLSKQEVGQICNEIEEAAHSHGFQAGFSAAAAKLQAYPNCDLLRFSLALLLEGSLHLAPLTSEARERYAHQLMEWYEQAAASQDEETREAAVGILVNKYLACGKTEEAQTLMDSLPDKREIDKQMLKINVSIKQGNYEEAAAMVEMKVFSNISALQSYLLKLIDIDLLLNEPDTASRVAEISQKLAAIFGFWDSNRYIGPLQISLAAKDASKCIELLQAMLEAASTPIKAPAICPHLPTKPVADDFSARVIPLLLHQFETGKDFGFLRSNPDFQALIAQYQKQLPPNAPCRPAYTITAPRQQTKKPPAGR